MTVKDDRIALEFPVGQKEWGVAFRFMLDDAEGRHPHPRLQRWLEYLVIALYVVSGMVLLVTVSDVRFDQDIARTRTGWILVVAALIGVALWITRLRSRWAAGSGCDLYIGEVSFTADSNGVTFDYGATRSTIKWVAARGLRTVDNTILIVLTDGQAAPIPDTAFSNQQERHAFVDWAAGQIERARQP